MMRAPGPRQLGIDEKKEHAEALHLMLADLKTDKAEMRAKGIKGGALGQIAKIEGISVETLKQRLYRWRRSQKT